MGGGDVQLRRLQDSKAKPMVKSHKMYNTLTYYQWSVWLAFSKGSNILSHMSRNSL